MAIFKRYKRIGAAELRPYQPSQDDLNEISVPLEHLPSLGDMVARNPADPIDQWLVSKDYFEANFETKPGGLRQEYTYNVGLHRVVDGDTFDLSVDLGFGVEILVRVRLRGVDAPETHNVKHGSPEHIAGSASALAAQDWFNRSEALTMRTTKAKGKFGRYLADIENERGEDLAETLLSGGYARAADENGRAIEGGDG